MLSEPTVIVSVVSEELAKLINEGEGDGISFWR
jgi:hypothetical protein